MADRVTEQAAAIANQAEAIAAGTLIGSRRAAALRLINNAQTLLAYIESEENAR